MYTLPTFRQPGHASCTRYLQWKDQTTAPTKKNQPPTKKTLFQP